MGMVQGSCNPYKKERALKGVDLGEIKNEVLEKFRPELEKQRVNFKHWKEFPKWTLKKDQLGLHSKIF